MLPRVLNVKVDKQSSAKCLFICWKVATFAEVHMEISSYKSVNAEDYTGLSWGSGKWSGRG